MAQPRLSVIGTGYLGATHAVCMADLGYEVIGLDVDQSKVDRTAPQVISFSNHYPDVETKCDGHGHRIFVGTHDSAVGQNIIVVADPTCPGFVRGEEPGVVSRGAG